MNKVTELMRGFGHGVERVITQAMERSSSDECPNVPQSQTFDAVHERHSEFIRNAVAQSSALEDKVEAGPSSSEPHLPGLETKPSSVAQPLESPLTSLVTPFASQAKESPGKRSLESLKSRQRVGSIEVGDPNPRNLRSALPPPRRQSSDTNALPRPSFDHSAIAIGSPQRAESTFLGTLDEIMATANGRIVRRRVVLPYQITLIFGIASIVSVGIGIGILVISVRNAVFLRGPKAGPQLPEIKLLLEQANQGLAEIQNRLGARR